MDTILFYIFAAMALAPAVVLVFARSPVLSALSLALSFLGIACLYLHLDAQFPAVLQVLVYAGAIMALFLFILMLLDPDILPPRGISRYLKSLTVSLIFFILAANFIATFNASKAMKPEIGNANSQVEARHNFSEAQLLGKALYSEKAIAVFLVSYILLAASIGVVGISRQQRSVKDSN